jgi:hypothetical protein
MVEEAAIGHGHGMRQGRRGKAGIPSECRKTVLGPDGIDLGKQRLGLAVIRLGRRREGKDRGDEDQGQPRRPVPRRARATVSRVSAHVG